MTSTPTLTTSAAAASPPACEHSEEHYDGFLANLRERFTTMLRTWTDTSPPPIFTTDATELFDLFLGNLPPERRQHYNCRACRRFVERFGGLVLLTSGGVQEPLFWDPAYAPDFFQNALHELRRAVGRARVTGVFLSGERAWGLPSNHQQLTAIQHGHASVRTWYHMAVTPPPALVFKHPLLSADQKVAELAQDYETLSRGLADFPVAVVRKAHLLLTNGQFFRSEKCAGVAKWLLELHEARGATKNSLLRENVTWLAVATAPDGFCHVRSTMIGTLLEDLAAGLPFAEVKARFDAKMNPLKYQRPQAAPDAGNIRQAEEVVKKLGAESALRRRFATLADVLPHALWTPKPKATNGASSGSGGVFSHLLPKQGKRSPVTVDAPPVVITWEKFRRTVLPAAESIDVLVPGRGSFFDQSIVPMHALVTAVDPDCACLIQWDQPDRRNTFTWYTHKDGSPAAQWNMTPGAYCRVTAVVLAPYMWEDEAAYPNQARRAFFLLDGARDTKYQRGAGLFPELLKSELHAVRSTLEAHFKQAVIEGADQASACGIPVVAGQRADITVRVTAGGTQVAYRIDRWD